MLDKVPDFNKIAKQLILDAPIIAEAEMIKFIMGNFEHQGFMDSSIQPWQERKGNSDAGRAILTGRNAKLRDSIKVVSSSPQRVIVGSNVAYAKIHNEGGILNIPITKKSRRFFWAKYKETGNGMYKAALTKKTHLTVKMPKRQFMGDSATFDRAFNDKMIKTIIQRFKEQ